MRTLFAFITRGAIGLVMIVLLSSASQAATTADINVTVTISNVSVTATGTYAFGTVVTSSSTISGTAITVTNNGNVAETFSLKLTNPASWTAVSTVPGAEEYRLSAMFNTDGLGTWGAAHYLTTSSVASSVTQFAGDERGDAVAAAATRSLWLKFQAPSSTAVTTQQTIVVTVTAAAS